MKHILTSIFILCLCLFTFHLFAQNAFYDAKNLSRWVATGTDIGGNKTFKLSPSKFSGTDTAIQRRTYDSIVSVLKTYFPIDTGNVNNSNTVTSILQKNPFFESFSVLGLPHGQNAGKEFLNISSAISSIGGLDVTKYANAIADLMIDRAKQELTIAFFNRFKKFSEDNPEFKILFPKTTDNLANLLTYSYPQMLPALRNGFFADLKQITYNLDDVLDLPRYRTLLKDFPEVRMAIKSLRIVHELETGASNAADIIKEFSEFEEWGDTGNKEMYNAGSCIKVAALFSESIRVDSNIVKNEVWVTAKEVKSLFTDAILFKIYLGLIYQQSKGIEFYKSDGTKIAFSELLKGKKDDLFILQTKIKEYFDLAANVNTAFKDLQSKIKNDESPSNTDIYNYINTSIDAIEYGFGIMKVFHIDNISLAPDKYLAVARKSNDLYKSIYSKEYTQAIEHAFDLFSKLNAIIKPKLLIDDIKKANSVTSYSGIANDEVKRLKNGDQLFGEITGEKIDSVANINSANLNIKQLVQYRGMEHFMAFLDKVKPYALFMANMVEADSEEEVKAALNNVILPVGSSTIKKNTAGLGNLSVQSYLGAYYSFSSPNSNFPNSWDDKWGVIAPIGISWTPGVFSWKRCGSLSIFASLLDLGAIVDYKLVEETRVNDDGTTEDVIVKDYKIELGQIFSPGGYLVYGFPWNLPLSFGIGGQYGPGLSKIDAGSNTVVTNPSWRWNAFLAVDIPLFNLANHNKGLHTKRKK